MLNAPHLALIFFSQQNGQNMSSFMVNQLGDAMSRWKLKKQLSKAWTRLHNWVQLYSGQWSVLKVYDDKIRQLKATTVLPTSVSRTVSDCVANTVTHTVPAVRAQAELHAPCKDKMSVL